MHKTLTHLAAAGSLMLAALPSAHALTTWTLGPAESSTTQGLTYTLSGSENSATQWGFSLAISGINVGGTDLELGRTMLNDLSLSKPTSYAGASLAGATTFLGGMGASGCSGNGNSQFCFDEVNTAVSGSTMSLNFTIDAPTASFAAYVPHLKVNWLGSKNNYDLVSADMAVVSAVPEPETYALMALGLAAISALRLRRNRQPAPQA